MYAIVTIDPRQVQNRLGVSQERLARAVDVSSRTVESGEERDERPASKFDGRTPWEMIERGEGGGI